MSIHKRGRQEQQLYSMNGISSINSCLSRRTLSYTPFPSLPQAHDFVSLRFLFGALEILLKPAHAVLPWSRCCFFSLLRVLLAPPLSSPPLTTLTTHLASHLMLRDVTEAGASLHAEPRLDLPLLELPGGAQDRADGTGERRVPGGRLTTHLSYKSYKFISRVS